MLAGLANPQWAQDNFVFLELGAVDIGIHHLSEKIHYDFQGAPYSRRQGRMVRWRMDQH